jgi:hypothetical protein
LIKECISTMQHRPRLLKRGPQILKSITAGKKAHEMAASFGPKQKTVNHQLKVLFFKTGVRKTHLYRVRLRLGSPKAAKWQLAEVAGLVSDGAPCAPQLE